MTTVYNKFNRGEIDDLALAREDVEKVSNTGRLMENWLPMRLGPMRYRPGFGYLNSIPYSAAYMIDFVRDIDDVALIEMSAQSARIWVDDAPISRTTVATTWANGSFTTDIASWTDDSGAGASTAWNSASSGRLQLSGTGSSSAVLYQTSSTTEIFSEHGFNFEIEGGPVTVQIGINGVYSKDIFEGVLPPGSHSIAFTPAADFTITLSSSAKYDVYVAEAALETTGTVTLGHSVSALDLTSIRYDQSADIIYCAARNTAPFQIMRWGTRSWGIAQYRSDNGPFGIINAGDITMTPSALTGDTTLTASRDFFTSDHIGALFKLASSGQAVTAAVSAQDNGTGGIKVAGSRSGTGRTFNISITGTWSATVTLQQSLDETTWYDVKTYTANTTTPLTDGLDGQEIYYRLYVKTGDYTSGTVNLNITYPNGSIEGICRVTGYTSATAVSVQVLSDFGSTDATLFWYEGQWSTEKGYPTAVKLYEGRLWWVGPDIWGSESDNYTSFDPDLVGDSVRIYRTVGFGPVVDPHWLEASTRLIMGVATDEISVRSDAFGSYLTHYNANVKSGSNQGTANVDAVRIDDTVYYVQRSNRKIYGLLMEISSDKAEQRDLMLLNENIADGGIKRIRFTRQPETRLWCVLNNGEARVYTFDKAEEQHAWSRITTTGGDTIEDVITLPGDVEDIVYFVINRANGLYLERMAQTSEAAGGSISKHYDSYKVYTSPGASVSDMGHLDDETVYIWADGAEVGSDTVSSGVVNLPASNYTNVVIGTRYNADWQSNKLRDTIKYSTLNERTRVERIGIIARNIMLNNFQYGPSFDNLDNMPGIEEGTTIDKSSVVATYDHQTFAFDGDFDTDSTICLRATGPATIMALTYELDETFDRPTQSG